MDGFLRRQNLSRYRELLLRVTDPESRKQIEHLIAEELAKDPPPRLAPPRDWQGTVRLPCK